MRSEKQHIQLPNNMLNNGLEPKDLLIYVVIKSHMNKETKECFPALSTISKESGYSINTIRNTILSLQKNNYIKIRREGRKNIYKFNPHKNFEPFSYDFLECDLESNEKAYILASQQFLIKDEKGLGKTSYSNEEMSEKLNISARTISRLDDSLMKKGYLNIVKTQLKDSVTGLFINQKFFHLDELGQSIIWTLQKHEEEIDKLRNETKFNSKDIKILLSRINEIELENKKMKSTLLKYISEDEIKDINSKKISDSNEIIL